MLCGTGLSEESRRLLRRARTHLGNLGGAAEVVDDFDAATVTHIVTQCSPSSAASSSSSSSSSSSRVCKRTLKFAQGVLSGCWVVGVEWLSAVVARGAHVAEGPFEVLGITQSPACGAPARGRAAVAQRAPPLFAGLTFRLLDPLSRSLSREDAAVLLRAGGGAMAAEAPLAPLPPALRKRTLGVVSMAPEDWGGAGAGGGGASASASASASGAAAQRGGRGGDLAGLRATTDALGLTVVDQLWILDSITALQLQDTAAYGYGAVH